MKTLSLSVWLAGRQLKSGVHAPDGEFCALEAESQMRGLAWTDSPATLGLPDLRPLNDGPWSSDAARTAALAPLVDALRGWSEWPPKRRQQWISAIVIETVRQIIADLPGLPALTREQCRGASTINEAAAATRAAGARAAGAAAILAAGAGTRAAGAAAAARAAARTDHVLAAACQMWIALIPEA